MDPVKEVEEGIAELNKGLPAEEDERADVELDECANAMATAQYRDSERGVHKSLAERLDGASEEDGAIIVNEFIEDVGTDVAGLKKSVEVVLTKTQLLQKRVSADAVQGDC